jgi:teichuronic acid biosynthesis glycosyltransferase TuaG
MEVAKVSIIIPVYNATRWIVETINSVLNQTFDDFEIIAINDGSTDDSWSLLESLSKNDERIRIFNKINTGVSDTRNFGISISNGEFIALLDSDDTWLPENLNKKVSFLMENKEFDWVFSNMYEINDKSKVLRKAPKGKNENLFENLLLWNGEVIPGPCSNLLIRKKILANVKFDLELSTAADQDFTIQLAKLSEGYHIDEYLWNYRVLEGSMSKNISVMEKDFLILYKKAANNKLFESFWFKQKCFSNMYLILAGSWWVNGGNKLRALKFILKSILKYPPQLINVLKKRI